MFNADIGRLSVGGLDAEKLAGAMSWLELARVLGSQL